MTSLTNPGVGMTAQARHDATAPASLWRGADPVLAWTGVAMLLLSMPTLGLAVLDERLFQGVSVWLKPWKFQVSAGVHLLTLALVFAWLPQTGRPSLARRYVVWGATLSAAFEVAYITWQAAWGQASHFNVSTPFTATMYTLMGIGAVVLTSTALVQGVMVLRQPGFALPALLRQGIGWGLVLTFVLGTGFGAYLGAQAGGHWVGGTLSDAGGLPVFTWSRDGGDLRVAHFFGIHAVHFIALAAWLLQRWLVRAGPWTSARAATLALWSFCAAYALFTTGTFVQAVRGQAFLA